MSEQTAKPEPTPRKFGFMPRRLVTKLIFWLTLIVALAEGVTMYINVKTQERQLLDSMILGADQLSRSISSATWHAMKANHREAVFNVMQTIAAKEGIAGIRIFNKEGRIIYSTRTEKDTVVDKHAEACSMCHNTEQPLVKVDMPSRARIFYSPRGGRELAMITPIYNEPTCSDASCHAHPVSNSVLGVLDVALTLDEVDKEINAMQARSILITGVHILLIGIFIAVFTRYVFQNPIRKLIQGTRAVSKMQLDRPVEIDTSEELAELGHSFNTMRERLMAAIDDINRLNQSLETKVEERTDQLKVAHQKLLQSDRLASLGQLSASVAHEINNPVSGVLNLSMLMQRILKDDGIPKERVPEYRRYLTQIINETSRVGRIVSDLLAFSRRSKPNSTKVDLNNVLKATLSLVEHKLDLSNVTVRLATSDQLPAVKADSSQMQQVMINLVLNGAEAMQNKNGGVITLATRPADNGTKVVFEVTDTGDGIPPENLSKIFNPFFTTKEEGKGVGLGLAVVYGIVEAHGGEIEVKSTVGQGTTFTVTLPAAEFSNVEIPTPVITTGPGTAA